jgi:non-ribosomal peptide synthetase component E (peptide arylation enzyme)
MRPFPPEVVAAHRASGAWGARGVFDVFAANAAAAPGRVALIDAPNRGAIAHGVPLRLTYAELSARVLGLAAALHRAGLRAGDVLLVQMPNLAELVALYLAAARQGIVISPVPVQYRHGEIVPIIEIARPAAFCSVARSGRASLIELFRAHVAFDGPVFGFGDGVPAGTTDLGPAFAPVAEPPPAAADPDALFSICWTSGTEGRPKAVPKTHNNWLCSARTAVDAGWLPAGGVLLMPFPAVNAAAIGGLLMSWLGAAGTLVLHHPFDLDVFLGQIGAERVGYTLAAPALLSAIADRLEAAPGAVDLSSLRAVGVGSAPVDPALIRRFESLVDAQVINIFGSNEGVQLASDRHVAADPGQRARLFPRDGDAAWRPVSRTANGARFRLLRTDAPVEVTEPGEAGEMVIAGPPVFPGYLSGGGFERGRFTEDGWFRTGDLFEIEPGGEAIRFVGRARELIVRGGMKIAPSELDAALAAHPDVQEAAVAPWPDARLGERVCAFVVPRAGRSVTLEALCAALDAAGVARFKWPERLVLIEALPRNALAKVQRVDLARMAAVPEG